MSDDLTQPSDLLFQEIRQLIDKAELEAEETPTKVVIEGIQQGIREALSGQTIPLSEMWEGEDNPH